MHLVLRLRGGHCQVPCGIFDDPKLVADVKEAVATIKKARNGSETAHFGALWSRFEAMVQIGELSASMTPLNINQMTRWVNTKEEPHKRASKSFFSIDFYGIPMASGGFQGLWRRSMRGRS